ncbi:hypothetical protein B0T16DRAFT_416657, partial [Cercophora newfieldiana]
MEAAPTATPVGTGGFTLWGLNSTFTIVALVGIGVGALVLLCCCCYCCFHDSSKSRPVVATSQYPTTYTSSTAYPGVLRYSNPYPPAPTPRARNCEHGRSSSCSAKRYSSDSTCCACRDRKLPPMTIAARTVAYCAPCKTFWATCTPADVPNKWKSGDDDDPLILEFVARMVEQRKCSHGIVAVGCSRNPTGSKKCCACTDVRRRLMTKEARVKTYCSDCAEYYTEAPPEECPAEWRLADIQCSHSRSTACEKSAKFEAACCVCKDTRTGTMPRRDRTAMFCKTCASHWNSVPVSSLPASWGIRCSHGEAVYQQCKTHSSQGKCCACVDNSPESAFPDKAARLQSRYCSSCASHWAATPDESCPRAWRLKCPHDRALAWNRLAAPVASAVCCCACRDTTPAGTRIPKVQRIKDYCFACKYHWASIPDSSCPEEWMLGCRHGGMAARCLASLASPIQGRYSLGSAPGTNRNSMGSGTRCCACQDTRPKNMPKQTRTKTYCTPCKTAWNAWPDAQCPPEWKLLSPRHDCSHSMALECTASKTGEASCCACKDGRKFISLQYRLSGYCAPCKKRWGRGDDVPPAWLVTIKDLPIRKAMGDRCLRPVTAYPSESIQNTHRRIFDQGPRYGEPRFGGAQDDAQDNKSDAISRDANNPRLSETWLTEEVGTPGWKMGQLDVFSVHV